MKKYTLKCHFCLGETTFELEDDFFKIISFGGITTITQKDNRRFICEHCGEVLET